MIYRTEHYRVLRFSGVDALAFLQSQLTNDVAALTIGGWQWQGYCTAKGRLQATFALARTAADTFDAVVPTSTIEVLAKRLTMFRLRSKLSIEIPADRAVVLSTSRESQLADVTTLSLPDGRAVQIASIADAETLPAANEVAWNVWQLANINASIPEVTAATTEMFVPQMIAWDTVAPGGGVSFSKGCYPGQEIVARAHYRGAVKRHLAVVVLHANDQPALGADTDLADGRSAQICNVAANPARESEYVALVVAGEN